MVDKAPQGCILILASIIISVLSLSPPLSEEALNSLDKDVRYAILHSKIHNQHRHSTKTSLKSMYVGVGGKIYSTPQIFAQTINVDATQAVSQDILWKATVIVSYMVKYMPADIFAGVANSHGVGIFTAADGATAFPENAHLADTPQCHGTCSGACSYTCTTDGRKYSTIAGITNSRSVALSTNIGCQTGDPQGGQENILVHEFGHLVLMYMPKTYRDQLITAYNYAAQHQVWYPGYELSNKDEYWAEATASFFNVITRDDGPAGGMNKCEFTHICTSETENRAWLKKHDAWLFNVLSKVYTNNHPEYPSGLRICM
ncbi:uncharacterized protein LOC117322114 [Pecten maximus]|uniref:uncharacterized protein LOC117322114 n=1 Tax=Pecten maximus TaxID=6579 RepID=UPI0014583EF7|nr:uncharacterized protein LOC117322114 [Pecten maximus]